MDKVKKLFLKSTLMIEGISYLVLSSLAAYVVFYQGELPGYRFKYSGVALIMLILLTINMFNYSNKKRLGKIKASIEKVSREELSADLIQTQKLAEELRQQQEELLETNAEIEQMNEELEQQAQELRKSEALLEAQKQELRIANDELKIKSFDLQLQRDELHDKNEELLQIQKLLEEKAENLERANQYKSEFLANMSHELRTPLNSIIILSKIMYDNKLKTLSNKEMEYSETIYKSANDLLELINEILDLAKVEAGMMDVNFEELNLSSLSEDIKRNFNEVALNKGLVFSIEIEEGMPQSILIDPLRLKQIVKNLLSNAFKFTHKGFVHMKIYRPKSEYINNLGDNLIAFSIEDSGIGIKEEKQELIFKEFSQGDGTINRKYGGTGLGLSISEKFSKLLGGQILLSSKENEGSIFTLIVPENRECQSYKKETTSIQIAEDSYKISTRKIPVQFISSIDMPQKALEIGALDYTTKSITAQKSEKLFAEIKNNIKVKKEVEKKEEKVLLLIQVYSKDKNLVKQLERESIPYVIALNYEEAKVILDNQNIGGVLIELFLEDHNVLGFLSSLKSNKKTATLPVILYSNKIITLEDEERLKKYVDSIIIQNDYSEKRLVNEITLFLHHIDNYSAKSCKNEERYVNNVKLLSHKRIMLVDDDMRNVFALSSVLENNGAQVVIASNGRHCLNKLKAKDNIDLILMDIMMPEMDGFETIKEIRKMPGYEDIPIIALTAKAMKGDKERCFQVGANDYMSKPVDIDKLLSLIKVWVQR